MVDINIIVAFTSKQFGIGLNNSLPWNIKNDLKHFQELTNNSVVIMGRKTWESIPNTKKPLANRVNIIITSKQEDIYNSDKVYFIEFDQIEEYIKMFSDKKIFIIGGKLLYKEFVGRANRIYTTIIEKDFECDTFFPIENLGRYEIENYSDEMITDDGIKYRFIDYIKVNKRHQEYEYLDLIKEVLDKGNNVPDRTGTGTLSLFGKSMSFDISNSIPFLTTKQLAYKSVLKELLWFISGSTDSKVLEKQGVNIWKLNTTREFLDNRGLYHYNVGDCGPMYGVSFRSYNTEYKGCNQNYKGTGLDQLKNLIENLKKDPHSRRHLMTTFNPSVESQGVLTVCHGISIQYYVTVDNNKKYLSCCVYNRSQDLLLGTPFNLASYGILLYIIAKLVNMYPKNLTMFSGDTHIYLNHLNQVRTQLQRNPLPFPKLEVSEKIKEKELDDISIDDFKVIGYLHYDKITAPMAI